MVKQKIFPISIKNPENYLICKIFQNIWLLLTFSFLTQCCQTIIIGKDICCHWKHIQCNCPYPSPNKKNSAPLCSASSPQNDITNYCSVAIIDHNQLSPVLDLITTNHVDTCINNDDDTQSFKTPFKKSTSPLKFVIQILQLPRFILISISVYTNGVLKIEQHHWKSLHLEKIIFCFKWM